MPEYWYCCQCGDGAHNGTMTTTCPTYNCGHGKCTGCNTQSQSGFAHAYMHADAAVSISDSHTIHVGPGSHTTFPQNAVGNVYNTSTPAQNITIHTPAYSITAPSYTSLLVSGGAPFSQGPPERAPVYRWQCCTCGGDNSVNIDKGCATCCNHWRNECCHVYDDSRRSG
ncbi:hypothetical protein EJ02DRAFT_466602 [Clathrospora elynae]|uniref:Uncharacterized protein n=1 Tax=Clathrospora elynae TaxID=706981 RepID=A0A6A5SNL3_9PLEO|nr:hypothetical protein EJ02DRAFT_466602 [Clathrospora elynae]